MRICFYLGCGVLGLALWTANAAEPTRITSVVRSDARSGKLVRAVSVSSRPVQEKVIAPTVVTATAEGSAEPEKVASRYIPASGLDEAVEHIAAQHALPPALLHSVIKVESNYNPYAISSAGAQGLMQLIPATARRFGVNNVFNPLDNIRGGAKYLRYLLDYFHGNYALALAAYNAGEANVVKYGYRVPPFAETQNYLVLVRKQLEEQKRKRTALEVAQKAREAQTATEPQNEPGTNHITEVISGDGTVRYVTR